MQSGDGAGLSMATTTPGLDASWPSLPRS